MTGNCELPISRTWGAYSTDSAMIRNSQGWLYRVMMLLVRQHYNADMSAFYQKMVPFRIWPEMLLGWKLPISPPINSWWHCPRRVMKTGNIVSRAGIKLAYLTFWATVLTISPPRLPDVSTVPTPTCAEQTTIPTAWTVNEPWDFCDEQFKMLLLQYNRNTAILGLGPVSRS